MELFFKQSDAYRAEVIGKPRARVAIEAGVQMSWDRFLGETGRFVGMHSVRRLGADRGALRVLRHHRQGGG